VSKPCISARLLAKKVSSLGLPSYAAGRYVDPGEIPVIIPGPQGDVIVSDMVISTLGVQAGAPPFITLVSDNGPDLQQLATLLVGVPGVTFLPETGLLQDLSLLLVPAANPFGPINVFVRSDSTIPEPGTLALAALGFTGLVAWGWRRRPAGLTARR